MMRLRVRWLLKWAGATACLLVAFACAVSTRRAVHWTGADLEHQVGLMYGQVVCGWRPDGWRLEDERYPGSPGWITGELLPHRPTLKWWITRAANKSWAWIGLPLWLPFLLFGVPTALLWHRDWRLTREAIEK